MTGKLKHEIKQNKPFSSLEQEAYLNLVVLIQELSAGIMTLLRTANLSMPQYNVLRILRGAGRQGLTCRETGERMVHRVPDVTRLLDRLEKRGLVEREREKKDRRIVRVRITQEGLNVLAPLDGPIEEMHRKQLGHLGETRLQDFIQLIEEARNGL